MCISVQHVSDGDASGFLSASAPGVAPATIDVWPGFARNGKDAITTRMILSHRAGLPVIDRRLNRAEALAWALAVDAIEAQAPCGRPTLAHTYHAKTYGWLIGEVIHRITRMTPGTQVRMALAEPLGLELWVGLAENGGRTRRLDGAPERT